MLEGKKPARPDIPCTSCELYTRRANAKRWLKMPPKLIGGPKTKTELWARASEVVESGDWEKAASFARVMLQLQPGHAGAFDLLAQAAERAERPEAAAYYRAKAAAVAV
jgi:hypothetical protein